MYYFPENKPNSKMEYYASIGKAIKKKERAKKEDERLAAIQRRRTMTALEWFIIGILLHPIVGPLYQAVIKSVENYTHFSPSP